MCVCVRRSNGDSSHTTGGGVLLPSSPPCPACRKKITLSHFLPQSILQRVPRPKDCLEHYFHLLHDKWRPDQVMSETKCMQNYLRLFEENLQPDIHKFTVKVVQRTEAVRCSS